jgi:uncharacterized sulfatase
MFPSQHGAWTLGVKLDEGITTIGDLLREGAGYDAALIGKAHFQPLLGTEEYPSLESYPVLQDLEFWRGFNGPFYGFNHVELARNHTDEAHVGQHYALWMEEKGLKDWRRHFQNKWGSKFDFTQGGPSNPPQYGAWTLPEEFHYNAWIAERANARISKCLGEDQPFFLWASFFDPHPSYLVPEPWASMYDPEKLTVPALTPGEHEANPEHFRKALTETPDFSNWNEPGGHAMHGCQSHLISREEERRNLAIYYGMVSCLDHYIGKILDHLEATGAAENTLIVFTTDHGHLFGQHGLQAKGPFLYEDLIRVPMIVSWPGKVPAGARSCALQSLVDVPVTSLAAAGVPKDPWMTGLDELPAWTGAAPAVRTSVIVEHHHNPTTIHIRTYVDERYKITVYYKSDEGELFDLQEDPGEVRNLWKDPAAAELKSRLLLKLVQAELGKEPLPMLRISPA